MGGKKKNNQTLQGGNRNLNFKLKDCQAHHLHFCATFGFTVFIFVLD